jgi:glycosyltransferase involved in cell wall biosynthesis
LKSAVFRLSAKLWRRLPIPRAARAAVTRLVSRQVVDFIQTSPLPVASAEGDIAPGPLVVSGLFSRIVGVAAAGRRTAEGLTQAGLHPVIHDLDTPRPPSVDATGGVWIIHVNPPELRLLCWRLPHAAFQRRYLIGYWAWELPELPPPWAEAIPTFHEIWAPSRFVAEALLSSKTPPRKVRVMPHPTRSIIGIRSDRARFDLPEDAFVVLASFDAKSTVARKNPDAALRAYVDGFSEAENSILVFKCLVGENLSELVSGITDFYKDRSDIRFITETLSDHDMMTLIATADVVLSLHRSEGYGMVLAEAMALGICVVATAWSGNMDFMDADSSIPVPYTLAPVVDSQGQYAYPGSFWAEPDVQAASRALRRLCDEPALRARIGAAARQKIRAHEQLFFDEISAATWTHHIRPPGPA